MVCEYIEMFSVRVMSVGLWMLCVMLGIVFAIFCDSVYADPNVFIMAVNVHFPIIVAIVSEQPCLGTI